MRLTNRGRVAIACLAVLLAAFVPGSLRARVRPGAASANGVYVRIPIYADDLASGSPVARAQPTLAMPPAVAVAPVGHAAPKPAADLGPGVRVVDADAFSDPFAGMTPAAAENGPCAKASTCKSYALRIARWPADKNGTSVINWKFNDEGRRAVRAPAGLLESAVNSAMAQWSHWNSNIVFRYGGTTTAAFGANGKDGSCADGTNVITWDKFDSSIIAMAGVCMDRTGRLVRDADLAMNVTFRWENINDKPQTRHSMDIRSIVTHELGHWLGLLDLYSSSDIHQTMSGYSEYGETRKRTPALGDILGIQTAFPCGPGDTCPRTGIAND